VPSILELFTNELLKNDIDGQYAGAIKLYSSKYPQLKKIAFKGTTPDDLIKKTTELVLENIIEADFLFKQAEHYKEAGFIMNIIIKTLKIAQKMLAALLFQSPFRVGIAYNALHSVIKFFEQKKKKEELQKKEKKVK
jgi:hypothetical protein